MHHASALSNRIPILEKLKEIIRDKKNKVDIRNALEVASGTGAHLELFGKLNSDVCGIFSLHNI